MTNMLNIVCAMHNSSGNWLLLSVGTLIFDEFQYLWQPIYTMILRADFHWPTTSLDKYQTCLIWTIGRYCDNLCVGLSSNRSLMGISRRQINQGEIGLDSHWLSATVAGPSGKHTNIRIE